MPKKPDYSNDIGGEKISLSALNERAREVFRMIVESYLETGEPVGSRTLSLQWEARLRDHRLGEAKFSEGKFTESKFNENRGGEGKWGENWRRRAVGLNPSLSYNLGASGPSPATIRNIMADLEDAGLLATPHVSAGRIPTEAGFRLFVDGLLELDAISPEEQAAIDQQCAAQGRNFSEVLSEATETLSGLSHLASLVVTPKTIFSFSHIEFSQINPRQALVVLVSQSGQVENRLIDLPLGTLPSTLIRASNYLNARLAGKSLEEAQILIAAEINDNRAELDQLAARVVADGVAIWSDAGGGGGTSQRPEGYLLVRGQAKLLDDVTAVADLERIRALFQALDAQEGIIRLLDATRQAENMQIYIGAENELFRVTGCSAIIAPYANGKGKIVGAIGVIGPTRMNYARIIPLVDYTAKLIGRSLGGK
ncbi:MAG: heat-inducible transcriptional repressor HrcA [Candidatus Symbiobacter sp.]|nr:heat-inducible transcriptional repressor HrcA [Candidatus Symbiobacter sp.]